MVHSVSNISSDDCYDLLSNDDQGCYLVDVRTEQEWKETGVADITSLKSELILISWLNYEPYIHKNENFILSLNNLINDKSAKLFFICKSGGRSLQAASLALENGFINSFNVSDGFCGNFFNENLTQNGWINNRLPWRQI